jgi:hypothetical protein
MTSVQTETFWFEDIAFGDELPELLKDPDTRQLVMYVGAAQDFVAIQFPAYSALGSGNRYDFQRLANLRRNKRIASHEHFQPYFSFALPQTTVPAKTMASLTSAKDPSEAERILRQMIDAPYARDLLTQSPIYATELSSEAAPAHVRAALSAADDASFFRHAGGFSDDNLSLLAIAHEALNSVDEQDRKPLVLDIVAGSSHIGDLVRLISRHGRIRRRAIQRRSTCRD